MTIALILIAWTILLLLVGGLCAAARRGDQVTPLDADRTVPHPQPRRSPGAREDAQTERGRVGRVAVG